MADKIDKSLTQSPRGSVELPSEEEVKETVVEAQEEVMQPIRDMKIKQRSPIFEGIQNLLNRAGVSGGEIET